LHANFRKFIPPYSTPPAQKSREIFVSGNALQVFEMEAKQRAGASQKQKLCVAPKLLNGT